MKHHLTWASALLLATGISHAAGFTVTSHDVTSGATLSQKHVAYGEGCKGQNISPDLAWNNPPAGTQSFAIVVSDPDAPGARTWFHWVLFDIPASVNNVAAAAGEYNSKTLPAGAVQGRNSDYSFSYTGACPPAGDKPHHYHFTVYALKSAKLGADASNSSPDNLVDKIKAQALGSAEVMATFGR
ncbi:YbhB/YbcL family Raf kinase inhibitor-like protein [Silvimonas iriomotensis]|uniref:Kinase inhibitor n=1 Tax=Silvimonas iriomotensis TaxID=449662 RepID=A0ABQ2P9A7_9NEIS|nr:YbhB/YbcL family Raf kinase inhibitor-like protein [Silvimonas iriomotensis]GGP21297.1 kinase inhibitor [Silvimonas iriomotensis]